MVGEGGGGEILLSPSHFHYLPLHVMCLNEYDKSGGLDDINITLEPRFKEVGYNKTFFFLKRYFCWSQLFIIMYFFLYPDITRNLI